MELMVVILIVGLLAAAAIPMMQGRIDSAKWAEAQATAGMIRRAEQMYFLETGNTIKGKLSNKNKADALGLQSADINGTYFVAEDYRITQVDSEGLATIKVTASQSNAPSGSKTLYPNGDWE